MTPMYCETSLLFFYGPKPYSKASLMVPQCNAKKTLMDSLTQCVIMQTENCVVGKKEGSSIFLGSFSIHLLLRAI